MRDRIQRFDPRQNMQRPKFEIFHYMDPKPGTVEVHHHEFYEIYFFLGGQVQYRVEGKVYSLRSGDLLLINPMELHRPLVESGGAYERFVLWIDKAYLAQCSQAGTDLLHCFDSSLPNYSNLLRPTAVQRTELSTRLQAMVRESYAGTYGSDLYAEAMFLQFMVELNRIALRGAAQQREWEEESTLVSKVLSYIGVHYSEPLTLEGLAQQFYVSKYHLSHAFSDAVGTSLYRYITLKRLMIARQLLSNGSTPGEVSLSCGFGDYTNFYRAFRSEYGISPKAFASSVRAG